MSESHAPVTKTISAAVHLDGSEKEEDCGTMAVFLGNHLCGITSKTKPWYPKMHGLIPDSGKRAFVVHCCDVHDGRGLSMRHHPMSVRFFAPSNKEMYVLRNHLHKGLSWNGGAPVPEDFMMQGLSIFTAVSSFEPKRDHGPGSSHKHEQSGFAWTYMVLCVFFVAICVIFLISAHRERHKTILPIHNRTGMDYLGQSLKMNKI